MDRLRARRLLWAWLACTLVLTLHPFWPILPAPKAMHVGRFWTGGFALADRLINLLLYLPLGVLARPAGLRGAPFLALLLSLCVEGAQAWLPVRSPAPYDVAMNVAGAALGWLAGPRLLALGVRVYGRSMRVALFVAACVWLAWLAGSAGWLVRFTFLFAFGAAALAGLTAGGFTRPGTSLLLAAAAGLTLTAALAWPLAPPPTAACLLGASLGAWSWDLRVGYGAG
ncbi:MAG: VanZ family protein [Planctomycetaceae bacterium]